MDNWNAPTEYLQTALEKQNIRDDQYIENNYTENGIVNWVLKAGTKLSQVFYYLPSGIINKTETGIGATTLEFSSKRNSIIVEPIKITASSKAFEHDAFYVGSPTKYHSRQVTNKDIINYLNDNSVKYKKIVVVADSLPRIHNLIKAKPITFFLMIDEADAFQNEANFRASMEHALEIYKSFPVNQRALVTATVLPFSDPDLKSESYTTVRYLTPNSRSIKLVSTDNVKATAADVLNYLIAKFPQDKIMVAYNSVSGCYDLAEHLAKNLAIAKDDINVLCSENGKESVGKYYTQLDCSILPNRLNFMTSAYFSGFDINEKYHLVSISSCDEIKVLSEHKLKQIAGRCRPGLLSEIVVYDYGFKQNDSVFAKDMLIHAAETEIKALDCITNNYSLNNILKKNIEKIRKHIVNSTNANTYQLLWEKSHEETAISYLNIDSILEDQRVRQYVYQYKDQLCDILLKEGHQVNHYDHRTNTTVIENNISTINKAKRIKELTTDLKTASSDLIYEMQYSKGISALELSVIKAYREHMGFVDRTQLLKVLEDAATGRDKRKVDNISATILFSTLHEEDPFKLTINNFFKIGDRYSAAELKKKWDSITTAATMYISIESNRMAVQFTNLYFEVKKIKKDAKHPEPLHQLVAHKTPVKVLGTRPINSDRATLIGLAYLT